MIRLHYMCAAIQQSGLIWPMNKNSMEAPAGSEERPTVPEWRGGDIDCERGGGKADGTHRTEVTRKFIERDCCRFG